MRAGAARGGAALVVRAAGAARGAAREAAKVGASRAAAGGAAAKAGAGVKAGGAVTKAPAAAKGGVAAKAGAATKGGLGVKAGGASAKAGVAAAKAGATLRTAAAATVRQNAAPGRGRSVSLWNAFWTGDWFLVDHFDADGRRFLVARRYGRQGRSGLSSRQWQVAVLVAGGYANKQIAHELGLAESTVATYLAQAMAKLGVRSRMELPRLLPLERCRGVR